MLKEVNWIMEPVGFQEIYTIVKGLKRRKAPGPEGIIKGLLKYVGIRWRKFWFSC